MEQGTNQENPGTVLNFYVESWMQKKETEQEFPTEKSDLVSVFIPMVSISASERQHQ